MSSRSRRWLSSVERLRLVESQRMLAGMVSVPLRVVRISRLVSLTRELESQL